MNGGHGNSDLGQLQATMQAIEIACSSIQINVNPLAAEATILSLCQSPRPYQACQFIIENSQLANARFQAAGAIRDAAIREWSFLSPDEKKSLISFCLTYVMKHASSPDGYVQSKISSVAAQLLKRGWLEFVAAERDGFFSEIQLAIVGNHGLDVQFTGINFLESLVSEFSPSTSTALGLPREFHEQCRTSLEHDYLKTFYCWAMEAAQSVTTAIINSDTAISEARVCSTALRFMLQVLNWDFSNSGRVVKNSIDVFSFVAKEDSNSAYTLVQPGPSWRDILITSAHTGWVLGLYGVLREKFSCKGYWIDCPLAVSARKVIVQLCSLTGTIFPSDAGHSQGKHLLQLISGIIQWIDPPDVVAKAIECGRSESELLDGCRGLLSIAAVTNPVSFDELLKHIRPFGTLSLLSALMCEVVKDLMIKDLDEEPWSWVARDILLDTWTTLLTEANSPGLKLLLPPEGINAAANLFVLIVESELKAASASEEKEDYFQASVAAMDERLSSYALIARAAIDVTIPFLTGLLSERFARLHQGSAINDPTTTMEELYSLLLITGHVLADEGEGETPLIPMAIETRFSEYVETDKHPVVILSWSIIKFAEQSLDPNMRAAFFSPRLMEAIMWFLARWSSTYLMIIGEMQSYRNSIDEVTLLQMQQSRKALLSFSAEYTQGKMLLDIIVRISLTTLISYSGEKDLQALTCYQLLGGVVRRKNICAYLVTLDSWRELAHCFTNERVLFSLNASHQRSLAQTLVLSASGIRDSVEANKYIRDLTSHMTIYLNDICGKKDIKSLSQKPDVILVTCLLERLRGASSASEPRTQKAVYEMGFSVMQSILKLIEVYKDESAVVYLLLKLVVDWVEGQIIYLEPHETALVIDFCMHLLQLYSSHNIGKISVSVSSSLLSEANDEKYKDLRALLQLLQKLCTKDMVDVSSATSEDQQTSISQVIYVGVHIVSPLITIDMLKYPKLCYDHFALLSHMLEVYPEMIPKLNHEAFGHISGTLDFGLHHQDEEIVGMCLSSLRALAFYHYKERAGGRDGLGPHATSYKDANGNFQDGILSRFLRSLLQLILFEDYSTDLVGAAADALFPLILCDHGLYQRLGNELVERQPNSIFKARMASALHSLTTSDDLSPSADRSNMRKFRKNLNRFLVDVRGFLRTI
ncbi:exportin-4-like isoform X2 [Cynara cardunculus var. scolymus]|uniref:exportin-4-like isoform X2 n=1 Tax=Cynara cardunculus var. scolymus TaxID=59895 RepID=UPI000D630955|nr:exportin-4-like isoform X2 [Cynara cardunculus var. scolymus]